DDKLDNCLGVKRSVVIDALRGQLPPELICTGSAFKYFEFDVSGNATAAVFENGDREEADLYIGSDGANSAIRKLLFPEHPVSETRIKELVGLAELPDIVRQLDGKLLKTQSPDQGLSLGLLPCNDGQVIWYMQFDCQRYDITELSNENKKRFAIELLNGWPEPIRYVLENTDYDRTFMWFTKDMPVLPAFHRRNIVLTGDAAHLVLPFTSQGVNSALQDAIILGMLLKDGGLLETYDDVFATYHQCRREILEEYHMFGKMMAGRFLDPLHYKNEDVPIPLAK
ncbi:MAG TPA: NAD(P)/FAD-dependent oxidoreductase, partial [Chitinophagaceae bacterium]